MIIQEIIDALWAKVLKDLTGLIAIWSGAVVDIPDGWHLCDGTAGTVDLRDKFIVGAGAGYDPDDTGGANTHDHDFSIAPHSHEIQTGTYIEAGPDFDKDTSATPLAGTTDPASSLPPYYALAFIQKI